MGIGTTTLRAGMLTGVLFCMSYSGVALEMTTASRTTGVAPLLVFFDAVNTPTWNSQVAQPANSDYASARYAWDFGDDPSATWATNGRSKNAATGYVAAHVYENPGVYTVRLTITDVTGQAQSYTQTITVAPFGGTTYYVSSSGGNDGNDGLSPTRPFQSFAKGMSMLATNRRVLFQRGDQWTVSAEARITSPGPGIIGAYGSGARPYFEVLNGVRMISFVGTNTSDWRILDLHAHASSGAGSMVWCHQSFQRALLKNLVADGFNFPFGNTYGDALSYEDGLVECEGTNAATNAAYVGADRLAVLGCYLHDNPNSHLLRVWHGDKSVLSHNRLLRPGPALLALKLHNEIGSGYPSTAHMVISDNEFQGDTYTVAIAPQNDGYYELVSDVLFERNRVLATPNTQVSLYVCASRVTIRNNIIDGDGAAPWWTGIQVAKGSGNPAPDCVQVLNNTLTRCESPSGYAEFTGVRVSSGATNTLVRNNIMWAPPGYSFLGDVRDSGTGTVADHNLYRVDPLFVDAAQGDFRLASGSPADGVGLGTTYVWEDYECGARAVAGAIDCGAFESSSRRPGDLNCDGAVDFRDISPFVLALSNPAGYQTAFPDCDPLSGDINADGAVTFADINPFVALLGGG